MIEYNNGVEAILNKTKEKPLWEIETADGKTAEFDFVIVANGHYTKPYLPEIFENSSFKGEIIHSHVYRTPEKYLGKNVLVIGVGPSGTDISIDLTPFANSVSLLGAKEIPGLPKNIKMFVGWPTSVHETGIITNNNDEIECDSIIVSSGYQYDFSFLGDRLKLSECGKKVKNLYRQIIPASHPTIGGIGVPPIDVPFPLIECQVNWLLALWQNKIKLPPVEDRNKIASQVPGIGFWLFGRIKSSYHQSKTEIKLHPRYQALAHPKLNVIFIKWEVLNGLIMIYLQKKLESIQYQDPSRPYTKKFISKGANLAQLNTEKQNILYCLMIHFLLTDKLILTFLKHYFLSL